MPTYQYACTGCGQQLEVVQGFTDDALTVCPECSGRLRKVFSAVGVVFKGSGFYRNDSRSAAGRATKEAAASGAAKDTATKDTGTKDTAAAGSTTAASTSGSTAKDSAAATSAPSGSSKGTAA